MSWLALITAGILEIFGVIAMKKFVLSGKKKFILLIAVLFMISFSFLGIAMEEISMGTAYAIWTGIGAGGCVAVGILFFKESGNFKKIFFITLILASSIGLKIIS
ncbi:DMT family transporter [Campylobacter sp. 7477a]|uniref:DMT family transporter n=1 Tax=Campylobacter sp. 7477a TaxID=2735741 RepID=UPI003014553A|nr:multidrug efflux SMR transporter [Campylobacter sp. 7477a]